MPTAALTTRAAMVDILTRIFQETDYHVSCATFYALAFSNLPRVWQHAINGDPVRHEWASVTALGQVVGILATLDHNPPPFTRHYLNRVVDSIIAADRVMTHTANRLAQINLADGSAAAATAQEDSDH